MLRKIICLELDMQRSRQQNTASGSRHVINTATSFVIGSDANIPKFGLNIFREILEKSSKYLPKFSKYLQKIS